MLTCGLKLTHDGAVALIEDNRLVFSVEMEKIANNRRYSAMTDLDVVRPLIEQFGYRMADIDHFAVDGWGGVEPSTLTIASGGRDIGVTLAPYREDGDTDVLTAGHTGTIEIAGEARPYTSYFHAAGHVTSAYYASPFAARGEPCHVLVWDGGMFPRLYFVDPERGAITNGGALFPVMGHFYATAGNWFGPYPRNTDPAVPANQSIAGKLMAYISLGTERDEIVKVLGRLWEESFTGDSARAVHYREAVQGWGFRPDVFYLSEYFRDLRAELGDTFSDEDVLTSMHEFVGAMLVEKLGERISEPANLCFSGGCALNIKWNSRLRESGLFRDVWVPPFPNDSGAAIGTALCDIVRRDRGFRSLDWRVRLGPELTGGTSVPGWSREECDAAGLARVLHTEGEPVIVLNGRAELGPRALGGRSIIAPAVQAGTKDLLNEVKRREAYRPVAPICLESAAPGIFDPGTPDPYMLFDHRVRPEYLSRIPAIVHLDGTARLQTVSESDDPFIAAVLTEYAELSGIPVLCNTSANHAGSGFFPDLRSAAEWGRLGRIWSGGYLYRKAS